MINATTIEGYHSYILYVRVKLHFQGKLDYHKRYRKPSYKKYMERTDRNLFRVFCDRVHSSDRLYFYVANFSVNPDFYFYEIVYDGNKTFQRWKGRQQKLRYIITQDLKFLEGHQDSFMHSNPQKNKLLQSALCNRIHLETFCLYNEVYSIIEKYRELYKEIEYILPKFFVKAEKYSTFIPKLKDARYQNLLQMLNEEKEKTYG